MPLFNTTDCNSQWYSLWQVQKLKRKCIYCHTNNKEYKYFNFFFKQISGCHIFSIDVADIIKRSHHYHVYELLIKASVTEQGTGVMVNGSKNGPSWTQIPLKIQLDDHTNGFFKPGLPYYGQVYKCSLKKFKLKTIMCKLKSQL